jgi:hypothetical protein
MVDSASMCESAIAEFVRLVLSSFVKDEMHGN